MGLYIENAYKIDGSLDTDNLLIRVYGHGGEEKDEEYEIPMNLEELTNVRLDATTFYTEDSHLVKVYLIDARGQKDHLDKYRTNLESKKVLRNFVIHLEKVLYLTLSKLSNQAKLN